MDDIIKRLTTTKNLLHKRRRRTRNLFGVKSSRIGTGRGDIALLDYAISRMPKTSVICEFGTWHGYTSIYLGMIAQFKSIEFHTFDIRDARATDVRRMWQKNMSFHKEDLLSAPNPLAIKIIKQPNAFFFIDNGNKAKETNMYSKYCGENCLIAIHDWNGEVYEHQVIDELKRNNFEKIYEEEAIALCSSCRFFIKK